VAETHLDTIGVPCSLWNKRCFIVLTTKYIGGTNQLFSPCQLWK